MTSTRRVVFALALVLAAGAAGAVENDPLPVPKGGVRELAVRSYNDGVALLVARQFHPAQEKFEAKRREVRALRDSLEQMQKEIHRRETVVTFVEKVEKADP